MVYKTRRYGRHVGLCIIMAHLVFLRVNKEALGAIYTSLKVSALSEGLRGIGEPRWPGILSGFYDKDGGGVVGRDCYTESPRRGTPPREYGIEAERALLFQNGGCREGTKNQSVRCFGAGQRVNCSCARQIL